MNKKYKIFYSRSNDVPDMDLTAPVSAFFYYEKHPTCKKLQYFLLRFTAHHIRKIDILYHVNNWPYKFRIDLNEAKEMHSGENLNFDEIKLHHRSTFQNDIIMNIDV